MADLTIAQDILDGVDEIMDTIGKSVTLETATFGDWIDSTNKTKGKKKVTDTHSTKGYLYNFSDYLIDGTEIKRGDKQAIVSVKDLTIISDEIELLIDGSEQWKVLQAKPIEVSGTITTIILHLRK